MTGHSYPLLNNYFELRKILDIIFNPHNNLAKSLFVVTGEGDLKFR